MDKHLSIRSRGYAFTMPDAIAYTASEFASKGYIGPLKRSTLVALIWRVKKLRVEASVSYSWEVRIPDSDPPDTVTRSDSMDLSVDIERTGGIESSPGTSTFIALPELYFTSANMGSIDPFAEFSAYVEFQKLGVYSFRGPRAEWTISQESFPLGLDENDEYWINSGIYALKWGNDPEVGVSWGASSETPPPGGGTTTLSLAGDEIPLNFGASVGGVGDVSVDSSSFSVQVTEWYPYANSQGQPCWNASTGAPINGGPGA